MIPPIFQLISSDVGAANALLDGSGVIKFFAFGSVPQKASQPYAVWQVITGEPQNILSGDVPTNRVSIQIDVYASKANSVIAISEAIKCALKLSAYMTRFGDTQIDDATGLHKFSMDYDFFT